MKKAKERLAAEAAHQMTRKEWVENAWYYYKWWVIGGLVALVFLVTIVRDITSNVQPDYQLALLTPNYVGEQTVQAFQDAITPLADDSNGDGKILVSVMVYQMEIPGTASDPDSSSEPPSQSQSESAADSEMPQFNPTGAMDATTQMASVTRFASDMQTMESMLYITDYPAEYDQDSGLFLQNDGMPTSKSDLEKPGVALKDCPALAELMTQPEMERFAEFRLIRRAVPPERLEKKKDVAKRYQDAELLFQKLTQ